MVKSLTTINARTTIGHRSNSQTIDVSNSNKLESTSRRTSHDSADNNHCVRVDPDKEWGDEKNKQHHDHGIQSQNHAEVHVVSEHASHIPATNRIT